MELRVFLGSCRGVFAATAAISAVINVLYLTGAFFMLEIYDRVLPSRSVPTLVALVILAGGLYAFQGILDVIRTRVLSRIGGLLDEAVGRRVYEAVVRLPLLSGKRGDGLQPLRDLDQIRGFFSGGGPGALFDLPWIPLYVGICFLFHPWIGVVALIGAMLLVVVTLAAEVLSREPARQAAEIAIERNTLAEASRRNAEVLQAMGMGRQLYALWNEANAKYRVSQQKTSDVVGGLGGLSKILRMMLQSAVLATGAYLVIYGEASAGIIIAGSILVARALAPVELAIANWKGFLMARQGWQRLSDLLAAVPARADPTPLPRPVDVLAVEGVAIAPPSRDLLAVQEASFQLKAGQGLGIIGPSASGKSSLARAIVGVWRPARGKIRLDGGALDQWSPEQLGRDIGYLPQDVELFAGTIAQNIGRFEEKPDPEAIIAAARAAGVHDLVLRLADGYDTKIGESGSGLSAGQRQRIGLARALYRDPFLVVLDEPNSNLDAAGEEALTIAILGVRRRGGIAIVIAHRPSALAGVDHVLIMTDGRQQSFGQKAEVLDKVARSLAPAAAAAGASPARAGALRIVPESDGAA